MSFSFSSLRWLSIQRSQSKNGSKREITNRRYADAFLEAELALLHALIDVRSYLALAIRARSQKSMKTQDGNLLP